MSEIAGVLFNKPMKEGAIFLKKMLLDRNSQLHSDLIQKKIHLGCSNKSISYFLKENGITLVFNGLIYNKEELPQCENIAESIMVLFLKHGFAGALKRINGDFSVALYDSRSDTLWLGRDRFGVRPLYYFINDDFCAFATRISSLFTLPGVTIEPNLVFVMLFSGSHYRTIDNDFHASPYKDISQVPAAHIVSIHRKKVEIMSYWELTEKPELCDNENELVGMYKELFYDSVGRRLKAVKNPAFTLSGGMDSSSVLATAVDISGQKQVAVSTVYNDPTFDESNEIQSMLDSKVKAWYPIGIDEPNVIDVIQEMIEVYDEPIPTVTWLSHYLLTKEVNNLGFSSLFGGLGGDELNAGEYEYFFYFFADLKAARNEKQLEIEIDYWRKYHDHPIYQKNKLVAEESLIQLTDQATLGKCLPDRKRIERYADTLNESSSLRSFEPIMDSPFSSYLKNRTYQDIFRETTPCCLRSENRNTAAFGLDNILPFFDYRLVEFMFRIPNQYKIKSGVTKYLLREAMNGTLPEETRTRVKKVGWNAPAHIWFSSTMIDNLRDIVSSRSFRERGIYNPKVVSGLIDEHLSIVSSKESKENHMMFLWQMLNMELWMQWLDKRKK